MLQSIKKTANGLVALFKDGESIAIGQILYGIISSGISVSSAPTWIGDGSTTGLIRLPKGRYLVYANGYITGSDTNVYMQFAFGVISGNANITELTHPTPYHAMDDYNSGIMGINRQAIIVVPTSAVIGVKNTALAGGTGSEGTIQGFLAICIG